MITLSLALLYLESLFPHYYFAEHLSRPWRWAELVLV
jgi:hypothetical protein